MEEYRYILNLRDRSDLTIENYFYTLEELFTDNLLEKDITDITTRDIRHYLMEKKQEVVPSTILSLISTLKAFFNWLEKERLITDNPINRIQKPKVYDNKRRNLNNYELEFLRIKKKKLIDDVMLEVFVSSGIRVSEMVSLNWNNINIEDKELQVIDGKGGKDRITKLSTRAIIFLEMYKEVRQDNNEWVLQSNYKRRMSKETIERHIRLLGEIPQIKIELTPHKLRHTFATNLARKGTPIDVIQVLMGHEDINTTKRYIETSKANIDFYFDKTFN